MAEGGGERERKEKKEGNGEGMEGGDGRGAPGVERGVEWVRECGMSEGGQTRQWGKFIRFVNLDFERFMR